jgi:putative acetyltransferase
MTTFRQIDSHVQPDPTLIHGLVDCFRDARVDHLQFLLDLHDPDEDAKFLSEIVLPKNQFLIAEMDGRVGGFIAFSSGWVNHLYVARRGQRQGVGVALLNFAKQSNASLELWVFQANGSAIEFYRSQRFEIVERTDGRGNEARMPDVRMRWTKSSEQNARRAWDC